MKIHFRRKPIQNQYHKMKEKNNLIEWILIAVIIAIFSWLIVTDCEAQTPDTTFRWNPGLNVDQFGKKGTVLKPCVIAWHGGGFVSGTRKHPVIRLWCAEFRDSGFISFSPDYRMGFLFPSQDAAEKGISDGQAFIRYVKQNWKRLGIDTNRIYLTGMSAGSFISTNAPYMVNADFNASNINATNPKHSNSVAGVCNFSGAIFNLQWLQRNSTPILNIFGTLDTTVPINCGKSFGIKCCGGKAIFNEMEAIGHKTGIYECDHCKHCLLPNTPADEYNWRIQHSFDLMIQFFK